MSKQTVEEVLAKIRNEAAKSEPELRFVRTCRPGDEIRQGDVYLYPLGGTHHAAGWHPAPLKLASGDGPGSRHVIEGQACAFQRPFGNDALAGPYVHAQHRVTLTHPEHAHISLPAGWYEVRYQRDFSVKAERSRPVLD